MELFLTVAGIVFILLYISDLITDRYWYSIQMEKARNKNKDKQ